MRQLITFLLGVLVFAWVAFTLYAVGRFGGAVLADLDTTSRVMAVRNGDEIHTAAALTYHGLGGGVLVVAEILIVVGALALSLRPRGRLRLAGLFVLVGWTALWLGNAVWLQSRGWDHPFDIGLLCGAMGMVLAWTVLRSMPPAPEQPANDAHRSRSPPRTSS